MTHKIFIGVGGRFHADRMFASLSGSGFDVSLFTTLPKSRFPDIAPGKVHSFIFPEILYRTSIYLKKDVAGSVLKMKQFGSWFASQCSKGTTPDVLVSWSSFGLEAFRAHSAPMQIVVRDSAHISEQVRILKSEYEKRGVIFPNHSEIEEREIEEYETADRILVLSQMAKSSFVARGISAKKIQVISLGADLSRFSAPERKSNSLPLRVLYFGALSFQKGLPYLLDAFREISPQKAKLTCIGGVSSEMDKVLPKYSKVEFLPPMPQDQLSQRIRDYDVFVFPTLHDGYGMVLPQAMASGLVPVVSSMAGASELVTDGKNGFIIPPQDTSAILQKIIYLSENPNVVNQFRVNVGEDLSKLSWSKYNQQISNWIRSLVLSGDDRRRGASVNAA